MEEKYFWTKKDGSKIDVDLMDINHLRNTLKMIIRNSSKVKKPKFQLNGDIAMMMIDMEIDEEMLDEFSNPNQGFGI